MSKLDEPVFVGLSHIGQVFSIGWAVKFGACATFDFHPENLKRFKQGILTDEEPDLPATFEQYRGKIEVYDEPSKIIDHSLVFLTMDTPLDLDGEPRFDEVFNFISRCKPYVRECATLILLSQVYPGFCETVKEHLFHDRQDIKFIYMVDTLKMGAALPGVLEPERLIFGVSRREDVPTAFESFGCKQFVLSYLEAEIAKISINLYLLFGVTFANAMDNYCRQFNMKFAPIAESLRHDVRIGLHAYVSPSLGISGGHLERDLTTVINSCVDGGTRLLFEQIKSLNALRMNVLYQAVQGGHHGRLIGSVLWVGTSYKRASFSLVNSPFIKFVKRFRGEIIVKAYDSYYHVPQIEGVVPVADLEVELSSVDCLIFNYASRRDMEKVEQALVSNDQLLVFDISLPPSLSVVQGNHLRATVRRVF